MTTIAAGSSSPLQLPPLLMSMLLLLLAASDGAVATKHKKMIAGSDVSVNELVDALYKEMRPAGAATLLVYELYHRADKGAHIAAEDVEAHAGLPRNDDTANDDETPHKAGMTGEIF